MAPLLGLILCMVHMLLHSHSQTIITTLPGFPGPLPSKVETGYVGVGERENLQLFYYFVESQRNPEDDPIMIRIAGGPGCSGISTFFFGCGPLVFDYTKLKDDEQNLEYNPYGWTQVANGLYFDAPTSGFSYAKNLERYRNSDTLNAKYTHEFLRKWIHSHPKFKNNPVYVVCVSYSGIICPILVQDIFNGNDAGNEPSINIKGYIIGNPLTDRYIDFNSRIPYAHAMALLSDEIYKSVKINCNNDFISTDPRNSLCAKNLEEVEKCLENISIDNILEPICTTSIFDLPKSDGSFEEKNEIYNPLQFPEFPKDWCRVKTYEYLQIWINRKAVQSALGIREGTITDAWTSCNDEHYMLGRNDSATYSYNVPSSIAYHKNFTQKNIRALIYSGDHDMTFPYLGTRKWIRSLHLLVNHTWVPWYVNNQVAGYEETFFHGDYSLTFSTIKGAGHITQETKPEQTLSMIGRWLDDSPL